MSRSKSCPTPRSVLAILGLALTPGLLLEVGIGGVGQRVIFVLLYAWAIGVSIRILRTERQGAG